MSYHIAVGEVDTQILVFTALQALNELVGYFSALHPGALLKGNDVARNFDIGFKLFVKLTALISVPEIGYVAVLLRFRDSELIYSRSNEIFALRIGDFGGIYEVA